MGTKWDKGGTSKDMVTLDFSSDKGAAGDASVNGVETSEAEVGGLFSGYLELIAEVTHIFIG